MRIFRGSDEGLEEYDKLDKNILYRLFSGVGLFETMKILNGYPLFIEEHIDRMDLAARKVWGKGIDKEFVLRASVDISKYESNIGVLKVILVEDNLKFFLFFVLDKYPYSYTAGLRLKITEYERNPKSFSSGLKPLSYFDNVVLRERSNREGFDEAVLLSGGYIAEGTRSNIFWIRKDKVFTPPLELGILKGITRTKVIELCKSLGIDVQETKEKPEEILRADAVFLTSSLMGVAPVKEIIFLSNTQSFKNNGLAFMLKEKFSEFERSYISDKLGFISARSSPHQKV